MPGAFQSLWDGSNPLQEAVPGLVLEVQVGSTMSVRAQIIKNGLNRVQNRPFGLKLGPEACQDRSGAFGMGLTHSKGPSPAKKVKKCAQATPGRAGEAARRSHLISFLGKDLNPFDRMLMKMTIYRVCALQNV